MRTYLWLFGLVVVLPTAILLLARLFTTSISLKLVVGYAAFLSVIAILFGILAGINSVIRTADGGARIRAFAFYHLDANAGDLRQPARLAPSLAALGDDVPAWRSNGISVPGYHAGWYRTRTGKSAFLAITDSKAPVALFREVGADSVDLIISQDLLTGVRGTQGPAR